MRAVPMRTKYLPVYAATVVLTQIVIALPGLPDPESAGARNFWIAVEVVLLYFLWRDSAIAWALAFLLKLLPLAFAVFLLADIPEPGVLAVLGLAILSLFALIRLLRVERIEHVEPEPNRS